MSDVPVRGTYKLDLLGLRIAPLARRALRQPSSWTHDIRSKPRSVSLPAELTYHKVRGARRSSLTPQSPATLRG
jgi:hypothetical protein